MRTTNLSPTTPEPLMNQPVADSADARAYARTKYRLMLVDLAAGLAWLAWFYLSGWSTGLTAWWTERLPNQPLIILGYLAAFGAAYYLVMLPLHFYSSFTVEHRYGLSRMRIADWLIREAKHLAV